MRRLNVVIVAINDGCMPVLNLTLFPQYWNWTAIDSPMENGVLFNADEKEENVIFIGKVGNNEQSQVHMVRLFAMLLTMCMSKTTLGQPKLVFITDWSL